MSRRRQLRCRWRQLRWQGFGEVGLRYHLTSTPSHHSRSLALPACLPLVSHGRTLAARVRHAESGGDTRESEWLSLCFPEERVPLAMGPWHIGREGGERERERKERERKERTLVVQCTRLTLCTTETNTMHSLCEGEEANRDRDRACSTFSVQSQLSIFGIIVAPLLR